MIAACYASPGAGCYEPRAHALAGSVIVRRGGPSRGAANAPTIRPMSDHAAIVRAFDHAKANALPAVLATVVGTSGSTYRKSGARMILVADGTRVGVVSGGCLEADVARRAWFLKRPGQAELVRYDTGIGEDSTYEFGLGCRGVVEVLLERLDTGAAAKEPAIIRALRAAIEERTATRFMTVIDGARIGERIHCDSSDHALGDGETIVESITPPVQLIVFGSGPDVRPVVRLANAVGWQTIVIDRTLNRENAVEAHRALAVKADGWHEQVPVDPRTAAVVMTHRMIDDAAYLQSLVGTPVAYVGCLGPASRTEALLDQLAANGTVLDAGFRAKLHAPVGLDLGGERPEEIALAMIAEVQAVLSDASAARLRDRQGPIHLFDAKIRLPLPSANLA